jgi:TRIAD3 protein (E3 ubiquitin-protein ligase RNF216)
MIQCSFFAGAHFVRCMAEDCDAGRLTLGALQMVLEGKTLQLLVKRAQQDELRSANLANMDSCPFCDFAMIIDNELERLFRCLNPECLRESCRYGFHMFSSAVGTTETNPPKFLLFAT